MKYAKKACGDLWGQSTILKVVPGNYQQPGKGSEHYIKAKWHKGKYSQKSCVHNL